MKAVFLSAFAVAATTCIAQSTVSLPEVTVYSPRVANQAPAGTFAMPVSALRYEPAVDIHARNLAEGQADLTIRGGIFENVGFQLGAVTVADPQTGHYLAELPVAPALLTAPQIVTGAGLTLGANNATSGAIVQGWREIRTAGAAGVGAGENGLVRGEFYQGYAAPLRGGTGHLGVDVSVAHSESDGAVRWGDHRFDRVNGRVQLRTATAQTDLFAGYQAKFFGWPNLYTPFNSNETENLQTTLFALNHRVALGGGDFAEAGVYHRRNKDDYAFNRFAPVGPVHPFQHTTRMSGAAAGGRRDFGAFALGFRAELADDELESTSLTAGRYRSRTFTRLALVPEKSWTAADGSRTTVRGGAAYDDTNRNVSAVSPVFEIVRERPSAALRRLHFSAGETTQLPTYTALNSAAGAGLFRGNPNLGRQTSRNVEIGAAGLVGGWSTQAALFYRRDDALVDWTFRRGVTARTANAVDIDVAGFEAVARRSWAAVDLVVGYTALAKDEDYRGAAVDASFYALNYARHRLTVAVTARLGQGFELRGDNVARLQADNLLRTVGGDDALATALGLAYRPPAWRRVEFSVQVDNLWDSDFQDVPAVPASPRQWSAGVAYTW